jgi:uncharacterized membrane protein
MMADEDTRQQEASGTTTETPAEAVTAGAVQGYHVVVAQFPDAAAAGQAYEALRRLETEVDGISGVVIARRDAKGTVSLDQMTEHSTRKGLKWGIVGGVVVGVLFPPSILAGAIGAGALGAAIGKVRNVRTRTGLAGELEDALDPGATGVVVLADGTAVEDVRRALRSADRIVGRSIDSELAARIQSEAGAELHAEAEQAQDQDAIKDLQRFGHA